MKRLSPIDAGFLTGETRQTPMHVGSLLLYHPPEGSGPDFVAELVRDFVSVEEFGTPYNQKLEYRLGYPHWDTDENFDIEYHLRHSALPRPGRYRELFVLVSRLHGTLLDRSRPLFEYHIIEGLESGQFALYAKIHHALVDGMAGIRILQTSHSEDPLERGIPYPWAKNARHHQRKKRDGKSGSSKVALSALSEMLQTQLGAIPGVTRALARTVGSMRRAADDRMALPFEAKAGTFNQRVTGARRFVAQSYSMDRIDDVRKKLGATVNDVVLAMCASALRRYLEEIGGGVPAQPLTAMAPVSVRPTDAEDLGNAVSAVLVNLGTHIADPLKRLETIRRSMNDGKTLVGDLSYREVMLYTMMMFGPMFAPTLFGVADKLPAFNVVISNVPGPRKPLYWNGARLDGMYPMSIVFHGNAVNFTVTSYARSLDFGIVACRRTAPRIQRMIDYLDDGLRELESIGG